LGSRARESTSLPSPFLPSGSRCQEKTDPQDLAKDPPALADIDAIRARGLADRHIVENDSRADARAFDLQLNHLREVDAVASETNNAQAFRSTVKDGASSGTSSRGYGSVWRAVARLRSLASLDHKRMGSNDAFRSLRAGASANRHR